MTFMWLISTVIAKTKHLWCGAWLYVKKTKIKSKGQFPISGIFWAGGILDNKRLLSRNNLFNFRVTFPPTKNRISARSLNSTDWKLALSSLKFQILGWSSRHLSFTLRLRITILGSWFILEFLQRFSLALLQKMESKGNFHAAAFRSE